MRTNLIRSFVALPLPERQREQLATYLAVCSLVEPGLSWVPAENLHLTLRFLGSRTPEALEALDAQLKDLRSPSFELGLAGLSTFGGKRARVVWLGLEVGLAAALALAGEVEEACQAIGVEPEVRRFHPHVTLARARDRRGIEVPELPAAPRLPIWTADRLVLVRSRLGSGPARYEEIGAYGLIAQ